MPPKDPQRDERPPDALTQSVIRVLPDGIQDDAYGVSQNYALMSLFGLMLTGLGLAIQLLRGR